MTEFSIQINDRKIQTTGEKSILETALDAGIYIPHLCHHPDLPSPHGMKPEKEIFIGQEKIIGDDPGYEYEGCKLCLVEIEGTPDPVLSCNTKAEPNMKIMTHTDKLVELRQKNLIPILNDHPHACLTCAQVEGCSREPCSANVDMSERCCPLLGRCELQKVAQYVGIHPMTKRYQSQHKKPVQQDLFSEIWQYLCIGCLRCVRVCNTVKGVEALGFTINNGKIYTGKIPKRDNQDYCKFCGSCIEVCPTGALVDRDINFADRENQLVPCRSACPAGINVPLYIEYISKGEFDKARNVVREKVPFPNVLGKVCFHPCEDACRRAELSDPISICALKDAAFQDDYEDEIQTSVNQHKTGKRIAIIGAGPCGLTAAYYLSRKGHEVIVFESNEEPGGMLRYGIPDYRLPRAILQKDIDYIKASGVNIKTGQKIGKNINFSDIQNIGFDAILIATGAWSSKKINIEGIDLNGVEYGVDLLVKHAKGLIVADYYRGKDVVVIGGGNVAIDTARTAVRLRASSVKLICLENYDEMPAYPWEIEESKEEGVEIMNGWGPSKFNGTDGLVSSLILKKCTRVFDDSGKFNPKYDESITENVKSEVVILSIGQEQNSGFAKDIEGLDIAPNKIITINKDNLSTGAKGIFAGGDAVTIPASVIEAIESGRKGAISIDKFLGGDGDISESFLIEEKLGLYVGQTENFRELKRISQDVISGKERMQNFDSYITPYSADTAVLEAERCLKCHQRFRLQPVVLPPEQWLLFNTENIENIPEKAGVYRLLDGEKKVIFVCGTQDLKGALEEDLQTKDDAAFFDFEQDEMFTKRESELIQQYLQQQGSMPHYNADLDDDLF